jgi:hypothetical protein
MKKLYTFSALLFIAVASHAQAAFWTENFGTGCNRAQIGSAYTGTNGAWTEANTGTNDPYANEWYVSATASGTTVGTCSASCLFSNTTNQSLHIGNPALLVPNVANIGPDTGSTYLTGAFCGFGYCSITNKRVQSPIINCTGQTNIIASFLYYEGSEAADDATFVYSPDGGTTWITIDPLAKTPTACSAPAGTWTAITVSLPATANNNAMVKIGFNWTNNASGGSDPSCAFDDIALTQGPNAIATYNSTDISVFSQTAGTIRVNTNGQAYKVLGIYNMLGQESKFTQTENSLQLAETVPGIYIVNLEVNGVRVVRKVMINE